MIFYTLGTQLAFGRMTEAVDKWCGARGRDDIFGQISDPGPDGYRPQNFEWTERVAPAEFEDRYNAADFVIAHAGMGSIITAQEKNKLIVVMPRRAHLNEHRNDHQYETVRHLAGRPGLLVAMSDDELPDMLDEAVKLAPEWAARSASPFAEPSLIDAIRREITGGAEPQQSPKGLLARLAFRRQTAS